MKLLAGFVIVCMLLVGGVAWQIWHARRTDGASDTTPVVAAMPDLPAAATDTPVATLDDTDPTDGDSAAAGEEVGRDADAPVLGVRPEGRTLPPVRWPQSQKTAAVERLKAARAALADDPYSEPALRAELEALLELDAFAAAAGTLGRLLDLHPRDPDLLFEQAGLFMRQRRWLEADDALLQILTIEPEQRPALYNLAIVQQALGRLNDARRTWDRVLELRPDDPDALARRGEVLLDLGAWAPAAADFAALLAAEPDSADAALNLALALGRMRRYDEARAAASRVLERHAHHVGALNRLAALCWEEALSTTPPDRALQAAAIKWWQQSLAENPQQPEIRAQLDAALRDGDRD